MRVEKNPNEKKKTTKKSIVPIEINKQNNLAKLYRRTHINTHTHKKHTETAYCIGRTCFFSYLLNFPLRRIDENDKTKLN